MPKLIGSLARFSYVGDPGDGFAAGFFWDRVVQHHSFATGGHGRVWEITSNAYAYTGDERYGAEKASLALLAAESDKLDVELYVGPIADGNFYDGTIIITGGPKAIEADLEDPAPFVVLEYDWECRGVIAANGDVAPLPT